MSDGAGEVVAVGEGVTRVAVGDRVAATYFPRWRDGRFALEMVTEQFGCTRDGMLAEFAVADQEALVTIPAHLSYEEASTLPCAGVMAWSALTGLRPVLPSETVLTIGSGGVALFALQFATLFGARVIAVTSSESKAALLKRHGADMVVNSAGLPTGSARYAPPRMVAASTTWSRPVGSTRCPDRWPVAEPTRTSHCSPPSGPAPSTRRRWVHPPPSGGSTSAAARASRR